MLLGTSRQFAESTQCVSAVFPQANHMSSAKRRHALQRDPRGTADFRGDSGCRAELPRSSFSSSRHQSRENHKAWNRRRRWLGTTPPCRSGRWRERERPDTEARPQRIVHRAQCDRVQLRSLARPAGSRQTSVDPVSLWRPPASAPPPAASSCRHCAANQAPRRRRPALRCGRRASPRHRPQSLRQHRCCA